MNLLKNIIFKADLSEENIGNENSALICGNSLQVMSQIKDCSIDLIFADPPYNINRNFGNNSDKWDDFNLYLKWCYTWLDECFRILKNTGTIYFMNATQNMPFLDVYCTQKYYVLNRIVWAYDSSGVQPKKLYGSLYEPILMVVKSKDSKYTFNTDDILIDAPTGSIRKLIDYRKTPPQYYSTKKVPGNVWNFNRVRFKMDEYENHPTQKPEALLNRIILASSNNGDIILDPFSGSFTTSAVALKLNRKTVGIELNKDFFLIGVRRCGLATEYEGVQLIKVKERKTENQSKRSREQTRLPSQISLL